MKIKLIHCSTVNKYLKSHFFFFPIGMLSLANSVYERGIDIDLIHFELEKSKINEDEIFEGAEIFGFDLQWIDQIHEVLKVCENLKRKNNRSFIFLGGISASIYSNEIIQKYGFIDAVVRGNNNESLIKLLFLLKNSHNKIDEKKLTAIPNLTWRDSNNEVINNPIKTTTNNLINSDKSYVNLDLIKSKDDYISLSGFWSILAERKDKVFFLEIGKTCQYTCSTCGGSSYTFHLNNIQSKRQLRSLNSVKNTILHAISHRYNCFFICYEFEGYENYYTDLFMHIRKESLNHKLVYEAWALPSFEFVKVMSETFHAVYLVLSPDSGSDDLRMKSKDKRLYFSNNEMDTLISNIHNNLNNVFIINYYGYFHPNDTAENIDKTIVSICRQMEKYRTRIEFCYQKFHIDPGAMIFNRPSEMGIKLKSNSFQSIIDKLEHRITSAKNGLTSELDYFPLSFDEIQANNLATKIEVFNVILKYTKTIDYILTKTKHLDILISFFRNMQHFISNDEKIDIITIKNSFLKLIKLAGLFDAKIAELAELDYNKYIQVFGVNFEQYKIKVANEIDDSSFEFESD